MVIIKFPEKYYKAFQTFKTGEYSKMYDKETIDKFFEVHPKVKKVLVKDHNYRIIFVGKLNRMFGATVHPGEFDGELDFKPTPESEIFNHHLKKK